MKNTLVFALNSSRPTLTPIIKYNLWYSLLFRGPGKILMRKITINN